MHKKHVLLAMLILVITAQSSFAEFVQFKSSSTDKEGKPLILTGFLRKPEGDGPFPTIVLLHGCAGGYVNNPLVSSLKDWGYVTLQVDSFVPRGISEICGSDADLKLYSQIRVKDAYDAKSFLSTLSFVDRKKVALMGWSHGGSTALNALAGGIKSQNSDNIFQAAVAFYPYCCDTSLSNLNAPILILIGELDDWTPAHCCYASEKTINEFILKVYPSAYHSFDDISIYDMTYMGHKLRYNAEAASDAIIRVEKFLARHLK